MSRLLPVLLASAALLTACGTAPASTRTVTPVQVEAQTTRFDYSLRDVTSRAQWDARRWDMSAELYKATAHWVQVQYPSVQGWELIYGSSFKQTMLRITVQNGFMQATEIPRDSWLRPLDSYGLRLDTPQIVKAVAEAGAVDPTFYRIEVTSGSYARVQWNLETPGGLWIVEGDTGRILRRP